MATLSGNKIKDTYQSLVKFSDNGNITTSAKQLTDGFGNNSPIYVSTTQVGIGVTPEAGLNLHVYGDAKIGSNLTVIGNLVVEGSTTTVGTDTLTVKDPLIVLANNNTSTDAVDIGFYGKYTPSGTTLYSGLFREALTGKYRLFKGLETEPTTTVNTSGTGYTKADLVIGALEATTGTFSGNISSTGSSISLSNATNPTITVTDTTNSHYLTLQALDGASKIDFLSSLIFEYGVSNTEAARLNSSGLTVTEELTVSGTGQSSFAGQVTIPATPSASTDAASKGYVDTQIEENNELSEVLANGNTTGGTDIAVSSGDDITFTSSSKLIFTGGVGIVNTALEMYHDGTDGYIKNDTGNLIIEQTTDDADIVFKNDNGSGDTIEYFRVDGSESRVVYGRSIHMADNVSIFLGNDDDGLIRYDSTADKILYTGTSQFSNNVNIQQNLTLPTSTAATIGRIKIGNGGEIQLYFDNTDSYLYNISSGDLNILSDQTVFIGNSAANETYAKFIQDGSVELYYNNSKKLQTTSTGIYVTGTGVFTQDLWINTGQKLFFDNGGDCYISEDTTGRLKFVVDGSEFMRLGDGIPDTITFYKDSTFTGDLTVDTDTLFVDASEDSVGIGETNPATILHISDGNTSNPSTDAPVIRLENTSVNCFNLYEDGDVIGGLEFYNDSIICTDIAYAAGVNAYVRAVHDGSNSPTPTSSLEFGTGTATTVSTRMTIDNSGNVGIGTGSDTLTRNLTVKGTTTSNVNIKSNASNGISILSLGDSDDDNYAQIILENSSNKLQIQNGGGGAVGNRGITLDSSENVGIGTASPDEKLDVENGNIRLKSNSDGNTGIFRMYDASGTESGQIYPAGGDLKIYSPNDVLLTQGGNVGINETNPDTKLTINCGTSNVAMNVVSTDSSASIAFADNTTTAYNYNQIGAVGNDLRFITSTAERMRIDSSGNVGIGTTSPSSGRKLHIHNSATLTATYQKFSNGTAVTGTTLGIDADGDFLINNGEAKEIKLYTSDTERMRITSGGNVECATDNAQNLGSAFLRWSTVYAANGVNTSDETLKENIKECDLGIDFIDSLKPKSYNLKDLKEDNDAYGKKRYGLIAQDLLQTELKDSVFGKKDGEYGLSYNDLIAPMIKAIQELKAEVDLLKQECKCKN